MAELDCDQAKATLSKRAQVPPSQPLKLPGDAEAHTPRVASQPQMHLELSLSTQ